MPAVRMSKGESPAYLHTLASVLAEAGNATAAREIILRTLNAANREEPEPSDWYVLGRIAEEYGERAAALDAYRKVRLTPEDADAPQLSCHFLAQRRIAGLETPAGRPAQAR